MEHPCGIEKTISLHTRDFCAESYAKDGTDLRIEARITANRDVQEWWREHRFDHGRQVFEPKDKCEDSLVCHDDIEAAAVLISLQCELNRTLV